MGEHKHKNQSAPDLPSERSPDLNALEALVGTWDIAFIHVTLPDKVQGKKTYTWLEGGHFLIERSYMDLPDVPDSIGIIGSDDSGEGLVLNYFDSRGVTRIYQMRLQNGIWKTWRDAPGFAQRFTGTFRDEGKTITTLGELSTDGVTWEKDYEQIHTKQL
ncbi:MAG: hypothetical protein KC422_22050 [Trueperaceae bacterium]|nr:hypothetical protein [Trueperaceae bacterium]